MPRNGAGATEGLVGAAGKPVDPTEWNRNDGFSPGSAILTHVPGVDLPQTWGTAEEAVSGAGVNELGYFDHRDQIADISRFERPDAPIVILNAQTGERHPFWSEVDSHDRATDGRRALILRPAVNFDHGARYIVALRELRDADGAVIPAGPTFAALRDGAADGARATQTAEILATLEKAGIARDDLYLAWDFTVASQANLAERMLHIRDDAFGRVLGDADLSDRTVEGESPAFSVHDAQERVDTWVDSLGVERTQAVRRVEGRVTVPNYLDMLQRVEGATEELGVPGVVPVDAPAPNSRFVTGADGMPRQNPLLPDAQVPFTCDVPIEEGPVPGVLYGHGLLGGRDQVGDVKWPRRYGFGGCAVDFWGMASGDIPTVAAILADLSFFPSLPDRSQQGLLNFLVLGRAMVHPDGLVTDPSFQDDDGGPLLVTDAGEGAELYYDGNSQGGILGGALVAVSPDVSRAVLGVPGMNYSTLLNRSVDWEGAYGEAYYTAYADPLSRQLGFQLIQMLWDRSEANGYGSTMSADPLPDTPPHDVMLQVAWSDHQVAPVAAEVMGRTMDAPIMVPGLPDGLHWEVDPYFSDTASYPHRGSSLVYWDSGNATPPNGNVPPTHSRDPHGDPRNEPAAGWQKSHFLLTGWNTDVCGGGDYLTLRHPDNDGVNSCVEPDRAPGVLAADEVDEDEVDEDEVDEDEVDEIDEDDEVQDDLPGVTTVDRVAGADRIATAVALSATAFDRADTAVLTRADDFPDALAASALAIAVDGPVLLTAADELSDRVAAELDRLGVAEVILAGGETALAPAVESALVASGVAVRRLGGADRLETAALLAGEVVARGRPADAAILARADDFPDALAAANASAATGAPILLTASDGLSRTTQTALTDLLEPDQEVVVLGGLQALDTQVDQDLEAAGLAPRRVAGADRYGTAVALADEARSAGGGTDPVLLASGRAFPDALAAGPAAQRLGGTLLLVDPDDLGASAATRDHLATRREQITRLIAVGGPEAVSEAVLGAAGRLIARTS